MFHFKTTNNYGKVIFRLKFILKQNKKKRKKGSHLLDKKNYIWTVSHILKKNSQFLNINSFDIL